MTTIKSVEFNPNYSINYPDADTFDVFNNVALTNIAAFQDASGNAQNLTLGASSNVNIEAHDGINVYFAQPDSVTYYNTKIVNNARVDTPILEMHNDLATTFLSANNLSLNLSGMDSNRTTTVSRTTMQTSNYSQLVDTPLGNGFVFAPSMQLLSNLDVKNDIVSHNNIACSGNMFSSTMNLYKNKDINTQISYAFYINEFDQLDIVRYKKSTTTQAPYVTTMTEAKRIFTFGKIDENHTGDLLKYTAVNEFNGIVGPSTGLSTGQVTSLTNMLWSSSPGGQNVYYNNGNVGIGTITPREPLDVEGNMVIGGVLYPLTTSTFDLGKATKAFNNAYVTSLNIKGGTITIDQTSGSLILEGTDNVQVNLTNLQNITNEAYLASEWSSNLLGTNGINGGSGGLGSQWHSSNNIVSISSSNIGINTTNPVSELDVRGTITACNLTILGSLTTTQVVSQYQSSAFTTSNTYGSILYSATGITFAKW